MKYCTNCGEKIRDGNIFCISCGNKVSSSDENGKTVQIKREFEEVNRGKTINLQALNAYVGEIKNVLLGMVIKPISTVKYFANKLSIQSMTVLLFSLSIIHGLLAMWFIKAVFNTMEIALNRISSIMYLRWLDNYDEIINIHYGKVFGYGFLFNVSCYIIMGFMFFAIAKYRFKRNCKLRNFFNIVIAASVPYIIFLFLGIILSYITPIITATCTIIGILLNVFCVSSGVNESLKISENKTMYIVALVYATVYTLILILA